MNQLSIIARINFLILPSPYADKALMLVVLGKKVIIDITHMLDYAAGYLV